MLIIATRENVGMRQGVQCFLFKHKVLSSIPQQSCEREVHGIHVYVYCMYVCMYIIPPAKEAKTGQSWASLLASLVEMVCSRSSEWPPTEPSTETEKWLRKHPYTQINDSTNKNNRKIWKTFLLLSCWTQWQSPGQTNHLSPASHPLRYSPIKPTIPAVHSLNCALTECRCPKHWDFKTQNETTFGGRLCKRGVKVRSKGTLQQFI